MVTIIGTRGPRTREVGTLQTPESDEDYQTRHLLFTKVSQAERPPWISDGEWRAILRNHPTGLSYTVAIGNRVYTDKDGELSALEGAIALGEITPYDISGMLSPQFRKDTVDLIDMEMGKTENEIGVEETDRGGGQQAQNSPNYELFNRMFIEYGKQGIEFVKSLLANKNFIGIANLERHIVALKPKLMYDWGDVPQDVQEFWRRHHSEPVGNLYGTTTETEEGYLIPTLNTNPMSHTIFDRVRGMKFAENIHQVTLGASYDKRKEPLNNIAIIVQELFESTGADIGQFAPLNSQLVPSPYKDYKVLEFKSANYR